MNRTKIDWCRNPDGSPGHTWNPITGCHNHVNGLCKGGNFPCYAYRLADTRLKEMYLANRNIAIPDGAHFEIVKGFSGEAVPYGDPFYPRFWPERLPIYFEGKPRGVFVCDMSDLFGVPEEWTREVLGTIKRSPTGWRFYLLTKQKQNLIKFSPFPDNCWVGVSVTNQRRFDEAMWELESVKAAIKYISFEPLLSQTFLQSKDLQRSGISWVIIGAQTKPYIPPKIEWVREIIEACDKAGIPVFLKNNLMPLMKPVYEQAGCISNFFSGGDGETPVLRQEMPTQLKEG